MFDLFILGAGFSTMSGAPKGKDILPRIFGQNKNSELFGIIKKILFPGNSRWVTGSSFNEILSRLDLIRYYQPYTDLDYALVEYAEQQLLNQMVLLLHPERTMQNRELYRKFVSGVAKNASFISFNYDLVLEKALQEVGRPINFGLQTLSPEGTGELKTPSEDKFLLKLHGSIDILYCPQCNNIFRTVFIENNPINCPLCSGDPSPLHHFLVAPTLYKSYRLPAIRELWFQALSLLVASKSLCFIGYSLPDGDILTYQLLDTAFRLSGKKQRVCLVNGPHYRPEKFTEIYSDNLVNTKKYLQDWLADKATAEWQYFP